MPIAGKSGKKYFKRKHRERKYGRKENKSTFRAIRSYGIKPDPFPRVLHTRAKYADYKVLTTDSSTARTIGTEQRYSLVSVWDPDVTGTGLSVAGYTELAALYDNYIVKGCKIEIVWSNPEVDGMVCYASLNQKVALSTQTDNNAMANSLVYSTNLNNTGSQKQRMKIGRAHV